MMSGQIYTSCYLQSFKVQFCLWHACTLLQQWAQVLSLVGWPNLIQLCASCARKHELPCIPGVFFCISAFSAVVLVLSGPQVTPGTVLVDQREQAPLQKMQRGNRRASLRQATQRQQCPSFAAYDHAVCLLDMQELKTCFVAAGRLVC